MRAFSNLLIILSAITAILFGLKYFSEAAIVLVPFFESILKNAIHAIAYLAIFFLVGYLLLAISKTDFYLNNLQSITQGTINLMDEVIKFWISLPNRLMKYGQ